MNLSALSNIFTHIPTDWMIIAVFAILVAFDSLRNGLGRANALAISLPMAMLLSISLPAAQLIGGAAGQLTSSVSQSILFVAVSFATYFLVRHINSQYGGNEGAIIQSLISGVATAAMVVVVWLQMSQLQSVWHFGPQVQVVFGEIYRFWWLIGSLIALAFVQERR